MPRIRPVSDLGNNFADEADEKKLVYFKLKEAELEAKSTDKCYSHEEVFADLRTRL